MEFLDIRTSTGSYRVTTKSGSIYTLELFDEDTDRLAITDGAGPVNGPLCVVFGGIVKIGRRMTITNSQLLNERPLSTSRVVKIEPINP